MKMGRRFGEKVGWPPGPGALPQTVEVRIVRGKFIPCFSCHWFNVCVVPKGQHFIPGRREEIRNYYNCIDYISKEGKGFQQWYHAPYKIREHKRGEKPCSN